MAKIREAKKGFEDIYEIVNAKIDRLEEEIKAEFAVRSAELNELLEKVSVEVELPNAEEVLEEEVPVFEEPVEDFVE